MRVELYDLLSGCYLKVLYWNFSGRKKETGGGYALVAANVAFEGEGQVQREQMSPASKDGHSQ